MRRAMAPCTDVCLQLPPNHARLSRVIHRPAMGPITSAGDVMTIFEQACRCLRGRLGLMLVGLMGLLAGPAWSADVSDRVSVSRSGLVFNRVTNTFDATATLKNNSAVTVSAPITLRCHPATRRHQHQAVPG